MIHFRVGLLLSLFLIIAMAICALFTETVHAEDFTLTDDLTVEDQTSCNAIGGSWGSSGASEPSCTLDAGDAVTVTQDVTLTFGALSIVSDAAIHIDGQLINNGSFTSTGTIDNGLLWGSDGPGLFINNGTFRNYGDVPEVNRSEHGLPWTLDMRNEVDGIIENHGLIQLDFTELHNSGNIFNNGEIHGYATCGGCPPSPILNAGTLENHGVIINDSWSANWSEGRIVNYGVFANGGMFSNEGVFNNMCGGSYTGNDAEGNRLEDSQCCYLPMIVDKRSSRGTPQ